MNKVSIITPTFNSANTIRDCIDSIRSQDYELIEHVVIDGGSSDATVAILQEMGVHYITEPDFGLYDAINKGIGIVGGEILTILNSDDYYFDSTVVTDMVNFMVVNKLDLVHGKVVRISAVGEQLWTVGRGQTKTELACRMGVAHPSVFLRSSVYKEHGLFSSCFKVAGDYEFLLRIWDKVKVGFLDRSTVLMREGGLSTSQASKNQREAMAARLLAGISPTRAFAFFINNISRDLASKIARIFGYKRI